MKRLLIITTIPDTIKAFFLPMANYFQSQGWQVDAMAKGITTNLECLKTFNQVWDVELSRNPLKLQHFTIATQRIQSVVSKEEYDIVLVSTPVAAFVTRYALQESRTQRKIKLIYTAQGFHFYQGGGVLRNTLFLALEKIAGQWTDYLVVVNREDENAAQRFGIVPNPRVRYIPGTGVNIDRYNPNHVNESEVLKVRQELGIPNEAPLFLSIAEFIPRKRLRDILEAFAQLSRTDTHLAFAGKGPLLDELQKLALELGVQKRVHFLGHRKDIPVLISASVATLLASEHEGLPNCVMESMCMGVPVIGSEIRGTKDLLEKGCGILVKVGNIKGFTQAMSWILAYPDEAKDMGKCGRNSMSYYALEHILKEYEILFNEALM